MSQALTSVDPRVWWNALRHGGMLLDDARLLKLATSQPKPLNSYEQDRLRRRLTKYQDDPEAGRNEFVKFILESVCGFERSTGEWYRGTEVSAGWSHTAITGEKIRPSQLWLGKGDAVLPVFIDSEKRIGMGRGVRMVGHALQWMRKTNNRLGLVTNGEQWRLLYAGLSYEAFAEWDVRQWLSEGAPSQELLGLRTLLTPELLTPKVAGESSPFIEAINDSRKGQAELSEVLGERVRQAAELLIQGHTVAIAPHIAADKFTSQELYRAAVRMIMRLVVVLFAESREALLPRDNPIYFQSYSLGGLREQLERVHAGRLRSSYAGYPRIISLCRLVYNGSSHESLLVRAYGGQLFEPGSTDSEDGVSRALSVLEHGCYEYDVMNDQQVHQILDLLSRTKIKIRQGRQSSYYAAAVDFSSLDSEYIGILYEGLLDFELRQASAGEPVIFLAVGNQPALPLATLEAMDDKALKNLLEKMKDTSSAAEDQGDADADDGESAEEEEADGAQASDESAGNIDAAADETLSDDASDSAVVEELVDDDRMTARTRAENWAKRAIEAGKLVTKPRGTLNDEKRLKYAADIDRKARQIITKVVLPGEWYLVRWGGTRKGSGTFYTRPQLAIPTVYRTLRPLCYDPPSQEATKRPSIIPAKAAGGAPVEPSDLALVADPESTLKLSGDGPVVVARDPESGYGHEPIESPSESVSKSSEPETIATQHPEDAPLEDWIPKKPEAILSLKVCDPACGSGTFPLSALRFLTDALYSSLHYYQRFEYLSDRTAIDLIRDEKKNLMLAGEMLPCRPEDNDFEPRTKAVLRRYLVERCIYGVDLDPLAVELCRLSLWIETLDPRLPFTFLNHKIKPGNSLIGTWFDQFMHYPAMAWMREGGDKSYSNGVHFKVEKGSAKKSWTQAISDRIADIKSQLIDYIDQQRYFNTGEGLNRIKTVHDDAEKALERIHRIGIHEADKRAAEYQTLRQSQAFQDAKFSLDLWCSIWFWPPEQIEHCPLVAEFYEGKLSDEAKQIVGRLVKQLRFFHWQLEFPDVFNSHSEGFDAILGNPPWDIAKPNSKEFFSALDPLYRSYGKQEAIAKQQEQFTANIETERRWLEYNAVFRAQSNWLKNSAAPFGNSISTDSKGKQSQDFNLGGGGGGGFDRSVRRHEKWKDNREGMTGYSKSLEDLRGFRHQGGGDINLYKMFLEQAHALLRDDGRMGFIVPSGIYSDHGTGGLRSLFLDKCRWLWLFGFENREGIFDIHRSFKFNPIIIQKGGRTDTIRTAFMRRDLDDWEHGEKFVTNYPRERVLQFSPRSKAILEIQSQRDLEVLEKIYSNSVLLGDDGPNGWGITYSREFDMTNDSKLFPPRDKWEERGYRPDEYSRWIKGNWQPRTPDCPAPLGCKRVDVPEGIVLSRDGLSWLQEVQIESDCFKDRKGDAISGLAIALPVFEGRIISHFDFSNKGWVSGKGRSAVWREIPWNEKQIDPQFLMASVLYEADLITKALEQLKTTEGDESAAKWYDWISNEYNRWIWRLNLPNKVAFMDVGSATNERTMIASPALDMPYGNSAPIFRTKKRNILVASILTTLTFDFVARFRCGGLHLNWFVVEEACLPQLSAEIEAAIVKAARPLVGDCPHMCIDAVMSRESEVGQPALTPHERLRRTVMLNVVFGLVFNFDESEFRWLIRECDHPAERLRSNDFTRQLPPKGFWRIDKGRPPEQRLSVLSLVAYIDALQNEVRGDAAVLSFLSQNNGEGWQLPETLRLADYGLGHDERAKEHQPVRDCFGPRFYDWQLEQDPEESWRECHLHARNLLGPTGYQALLDELAGKSASTSSPAEARTASTENDDETFSLDATPAARRRSKKSK